MITTIEGIIARLDLSPAHVHDIQSGKGNALLRHLYPTIWRVFQKNALSKSNELMSDLYFLLNAFTIKGSHI